MLARRANPLPTTKDELDTVDPGQPQQSHPQIGRVYRRDASETDQAG